VDRRSITNKSSIHRPGNWDEEDGKLDEDNEVIEESPAVAMLAQI